MRLGILSDTHGLLRPEAIDRLAGVGHILHAGDIGAAGIVPRLAEIAPVTAVRGNVDAGGRSAAFPAEALVELAGTRILVLHILETLGRDPAADGIGLVVFGHTHRPEARREGPVLFLNPGSAGPRRFRLPVTLATLDIGAAGPGPARFHDLLAPPEPAEPDPSSLK